MSWTIRTSEDIHSSENSRVKSKVKVGLLDMLNGKHETTHRGHQDEQEQHDGNATFELQEFNRDPRQTQPPSIDDEIDIKYEAICVEQNSTSQTEDDPEPDLDADLSQINPSPGRCRSINFEEKELHELYINLLQCDRDCETCQEYILKFREHIRTTHAADQPTRDPLQVDQALLTELKCEVDDDPEKMDCSEECDPNFEPDNDSGSDSDPDYNESPSLTLKSKSSQRLVKAQTSQKEKCFMCEECGKTFAGNSALNEHLRNHTGETPYKCGLCGKCFATRSKLTVHSKIHTGDRPFKCEECEKGFIRKKDLRVHIRSHSGEKPYNCEQCGKSFSTNCYLTTHMRSHTLEKPYKCEVCEKSFTRSSHLSVHSRNHTGVRPYKCKECETSFKTNRDLTVHIRSHTGERPYKCEECAKGFATKSCLIAHLKIHTGLKP